MLRTVPILVLAFLLCACPSLPKYPSGDLPLPSGEVGLDLNDFNPAKETEGGGVTREDGWSPDCIPQCYSKVCGPDGCGGSCGQCPPGTTCSHNQTMCIPKSVQKPLGASCGPTEVCKPRIVLASGLSYPNPDWPGCLHDQCAEGPCATFFCSRTCKPYKDVLVNGTTLPVPDGIEDPDTPISDCKGPSKEVFPSDDFLCLRRDPYSSEGLCYPKSSFAPCSGPKDCPEGEACGYIVLLGNVESRCLRVPTSPKGLGEACTGPCEAWTCSEFGCSHACSTNSDCMSRGARCGPEGHCLETSKPCSVDADCSAFECNPSVFVEALSTFVKACAPRQCLKDSDCGDPNYYCKHETGKTPLSGRCVPRLDGAPLGGQCNVSLYDNLPDLVCANSAYCLHGRCAAMCTSDEDCKAGGPMICALVEGLDSDNPPSPPIPLCQWLGEPSTQCTVQADCQQGVCTPFLSVSGETVLRCAEPPSGSFGFGSQCGALSWGQECENRLCLGEDPLNGLAGVCTTLCRTSADCPGPTPVGPSVFNFLCEAVRWITFGTDYIGDDKYLSLCTPVPQGSSLTPCSPIGVCKDPTEVCRAIIRTGTPSSSDSVDYLCVKKGEGRPVGSPCDPYLGGKDCQSGLCATTPIKGLGFCTTPCNDDAQCQSLHPASHCLERVAILRPPPSPPITVRECRIPDPCVACKDDRDCVGKGLRCADVASLPYLDDFRCTRTCTTDADCADLGEDVLCREVDAPKATEPSGRVRACAPLTCP